MRFDSIRSDPKTADSGHMQKTMKNVHEWNFKTKHRNKKHFASFISTTKKKNNNIVSKDPISERRTHWLWSKSYGEFWVQNHARSPMERNDCKLHIHISNDFIGIFDIATMSSVMHLINE